MSAKRWALAFLIGLAVVAGWIYAMRAPAERRPAAPPGPTAAALPLNRPPSALARLAETSAASAVAPPAAPHPITAPVAAKPRIGSEGYGPHIERAQAGNDAAAAWEAVEWLRQCASNEEKRQSYEGLRGERIPQEMLAQLMLEADAEGRLCQTVTARHRAMLQELALRAIRGGVPHAATGFAELVSPDDLAPGLRQEVADAMRRDANAGQPGSLVGVLARGTAWGLSDEERLAYLVALGEMHGNGGAALVRQWIAQRAIQFKAEPTPQQLAAAQTVAQQIIDRARANKPP
ncbi:hypothetical protein [Roseateles sp. LYH14W]|uniref:HEAT repeat domain-containing protein n=1 Tax=Pelomonas parva TaxID=3299032 RepID=A0ABW7F647_9BURK